MPSITRTRQLIDNETKAFGKFVAATAARTITAADSNRTFISSSLALKFTLPLAVASLNGVTFTFVNGRAATAAGIAGELWVDPVSADSINGGTSGLGLYQPATTDAVGDSITLKCNGTGYYTVSKIGTWAAATGA